MAAQPPVPPSKQDPRFQPKGKLLGASDIVAAQNGPQAVPVDDTQPR